MLRKMHRENELRIRLLAGRRWSRIDKLTELQRLIRQRRTLERTMKENGNV